MVPVGDAPPGVDAKRASTRGGHAVGMPACCARACLLARSATSTEGERILAPEKALGIWRRGRVCCVKADASSRATTRLKRGVLLKVATSMRFEDHRLASSALLTLAKPADAQAHGRQGTVDRRRTLPCAHGRGGLTPWRAPADRHELAEQGVSTAHAAFTPGRMRLARWCPGSCLGSSCTMPQDPPSST